MGVQIQLVLKEQPLPHMLVGVIWQLQACSNCFREMMWHNVSGLVVLPISTFAEAFHRVCDKALPDMLA